MRQMVLGATMLIACTGLATGGDAKTVPMATATLLTSTSAPAGNVTIREVAGGLRILVHATGLPTGVHGIHIHTVGMCTAPDFASAGGHWNPTGMHHGAKNPQGPHQGDLPNLTIGANGSGVVSAMIPGATLAGLLDADGAAIVVHGGPDDLMSDPAGNSGPRLACGVLKQG